jgi:hypothetical protein
MLDQELRVKQAQSVLKGSKAPWQMELSESAKPKNGWSQGDDIGLSLTKVLLFYFETSLWLDVTLVDF